jgi:hypothetical protein
MMFLSSCDDKPPSTDAAHDTTMKKVDPEAQRIIEQAIQTHGGDRYKNHEIQFDFRDRTYSSKRKGGIYTYERIFVDSTGQKTVDILTNNSFTRKIDDQVVEVPDSMQDKYSSSINSVIYFALLPYFLLDPAVNKEYLGTSHIKGEPYHKVKITFNQEGGGEDFEDEFIYWFHETKHTLDYLAYSYKTDGGGARFRAAYNPRVIGGIRFMDYSNYKPNPETRYILNFDSLFAAGQLEKLSEIETKNILVKE